MKAAKSKTYSLSFNVVKQGWVANIRSTGTDGQWVKKWLPRDPRREPCFRSPSQQLDAEAWIESYLEGGRKTNTVTPKITLSLLSYRWITDLRQRKKYSLQTVQRYEISLYNWIMDNIDYPHFSIQDLDIQTELTTQACKDWIDSIPGKPRNRFYIIITCSSMISYAIRAGWLPEDAINPFSRPGVREVVKGIHEMIEDAQEVDLMPLSTLRAVVNTPAVPFYRSIRYCLIYFLGLRDAEANGLTWGDLIKTEGMHFFNIERQLLKRGKHPYIQFEDEVAKRIDKHVIMKTDRAVVSKPKYRSGRMVPAHPELLARLEVWRAVWQTIAGIAPQEHHPILILGHKYAGRGHQGGEFAELHHELIHKDLRASSADWLGGVHSLRRLFSSELANAGVADGTIDHLLGHKPNGVLRKSYVFPGKKSLYEMVARLPTLRPMGSDDLPMTAKKETKSGAHGQGAEQQVHRHPRRALKKLK